MKTHKPTYDYPEYVPHITLSYNVGDYDISSLPQPTNIGNLYADYEYQEDLHLNWSKIKGTK